MESFLRTIAGEYARRYADLSEFCFVFPGRRSGTFFLKNLKEAIGGRVMIAPQTITIADFTASLAPSVIDNRIDLLFVLYRCYLELLGYKEGDEVEEEHSFDNFRSRGETILADFNDVDTHLVDPDRLFKNVADLNEISTDYLTDDQKEVMERYFNIRRRDDETGRFWRSFSYESSLRSRDPDDTRDPMELRNKFVSFWSRLAPLYHSFNRALSREGLTYAGRASRSVLELIRKSGREVLEPKKIVFVGFNVLTGVEWHLFRELQKLTTTIEGREEPYADFVWDLTGAVMFDEDSSAARFVRKGIESFPKPEWLDLSACDTDTLPKDITLYSTPSQVIQAKIVGARIEELHKRLTQEDFDNARVAVVLPDENLLLPVLHSLPDSIVEEVDPDNPQGTKRRREVGVNLTMGLPLRHTPVVSFVAILRRLQTRLRRDSGTVVYYHEDVKALLAHPFSHILLGSKVVMEISRMISTRRLHYIDSKLFNRYGVEAQMLFSPLPPVSPEHVAVDVVTEYITGLLTEVDRRRSERVDARSEEEDERDDNMSLISLTHAHIESYLRALRRLHSACHDRGVYPSMFTVFLLADRLIGSEKVTFEGEPLRGLQIMGLLETRSLDFDHIIIPSMNERIFPQRLHSPSFIPNALRVAYGMPTTFTQESIFAYYFYRMICRAKSVTMTYDSRTAEVSSGDPSRFVLQLKHLYARHNLQIIDTHFNLPGVEVTTFSISKDNPEIRKRLDEFLSGSAFLSASALQKYIACPMQFYFAYVAKVKVDDTPAEFMSAIDKGNVVHDVMMRVYLDEDKVKQLLPTAHKVEVRPSRDHIERLVRRAINTQYLGLPKWKRDTPLSGEPEIQASIVIDNISKLVDVDMEFDSLEILGVEIPEAHGTLTFPISGGRRVYFTMHIDRMDSVIKNGERRYRIVDYKTGNLSSTIDIESVESIFKGSGKGGKYSFQLLLYATLCRRSPQFRFIDEYDMVIYGANRGDESRMTIDKQIITSDRAILNDEGGGEFYLNEAFEKLLRDMLDDLFDIERPFTQTEDLSTCRLCAYRKVCGR